MTKSSRARNHLEPAQPIHASVFKCKDCCNDLRKWSTAREQCTSKWKHEHASLLSRIKNITWLQLCHTQVKPFLIQLSISLSYHSLIMRQHKKVKDFRKVGRWIFSNRALVK